MRHNKSGVTLVELLIVVLILGALAAIAIPRITASSTTAKTNACAANIDIMNSLPLISIPFPDLTSHLAKHPG